MSAAPRMRFPGVRAPKPLLSREAERQLSARQLELLDELEAKLLDQRIAAMTMAEIAAELGCSLRTLYGIAPSKDELLLMVVDRRLHSIGRTAIDRLDPEASPIDALRSYLHRANAAVQPESVALSAELAQVPGASRLFSAHEAYLMAVAQHLLERAIGEGRIGPIDAAAVAHVLGGLGREFARPDVAEITHASAHETANALVDVILRGLPAGRK